MKDLKYKKPHEWYFIGTAIMALEYYAVRKRNERTISRVVWRMKSDKIGKWLLVLTWIWLTYHFFIEEHD